MVFYCTSRFSVLSMEAPLFEGAQRIVILACMQIKGVVQASLRCGETKKLILTLAKHTGCTCTRACTEKGIEMRWSFVIF